MNSSSGTKKNPSFNGDPAIEKAMAWSVEGNEIISQLTTPKNVKNVTTSLSFCL